jgi:hypothetical protein
MNDVCELKSIKSPTERKILFNDISSDGRGPGMPVVEDGVADEVMATKTGKSGGEGGRRSVRVGVWQSAAISHIVLSQIKSDHLRSSP